MNVLVIELPLPPRGVSSNARLHHFQKSGATAEYRKASLVAARASMPKGWMPAPIRISHAWYMGLSKAETAIRAACLAAGAKSPPSEFYRPRDKQNAIAALKAVVDGFVDAKLVPDDSAEWVDWGRCTFFSKPEQHGGRSCVVVTIEVVE